MYLYDQHIFCNIRNQNIASQRENMIMCRQTHLPCFCVLCFCRVRREILPFFFRCLTQHMSLAERGQSITLGIWLGVTTQGSTAEVWNAACSHSLSLRVLCGKHKQQHRKGFYITKESIFAPKYIVIGFIEFILSILCSFLASSCEGSSPVEEHYLTTTRWSHSHLSQHQTTVPHRLLEHLKPPLSVSAVGIIQPLVQMGPPVEPQLLVSAFSFFFTFRLNIPVWTLSTMRNIRNTWTERLWLAMSCKYECQYS